MFIYKITNMLNGMSYVGYDTNKIELENRWTCHKLAVEGKIKIRYKSKFLPALIKYGIENFKYEVIEECDNLEELYNAEIKWIKHFDCQSNGYNIMSGGKRGHSSEWRKDPEKMKRFIEKQKLNQPVEKHSTRVKDEWANMDDENKNKKLSGIRKHVKSLTPEQMTEWARRGGMGYAKKFLLIDPLGNNFKIISMVGKDGLQDFCNNQGLNFKHIKHMLAGIHHDLNGWSCFNLDKKTEEIVPIVEYRILHQRKK